MTRKIKLLYIDDRLQDRRIFELEMMDTVLRDCELITLARPPADLKACLEYDGVILDHYIQGYAETGAEIARQLHRLDHWLPIMLLTGTDIDMVPDDFMSIGTHLSSKDKREIGVYRVLNVSNVARAFVRHIAGSVRFKERQK